MRHTSRPPRTPRPESAHRLRRLALALASFAWVAFACAVLLGAPRAHAEAPEGAQSFVLVAKLHGTINPGLTPYVARVLEEAERDGAAAVVLDIDTFGGRLDAAVAIRDRLLASRTTTFAFVHPRAISAGALIALATNDIAMAPGGTLGAATPVQMQPEGTSRAVDEKTTSYVRKEFRATAEQRNRPALLAEAMVDADVDAGPAAPAGKLLTVTTEEALALKLADRRAASLAELLDAHGLGNADVREVRANWAEHLARALTLPVVSSILMTLGILGLIAEIRTPGFGVPGIVGILCLVLFFFGHGVVELAGWEELVLVGFGAALLLVEVFVTPGFGLPGIAGIGLVTAGLGMSLMGSGASPSAVVSALAQVTVSLAAAVGLLVVLLAALPKLLPRAAARSGIVLHAQIGGRRDRETPGVRGADAAAFDASGHSGHSGHSGLDRTEATTLVGAMGATLTPLRPAGRALFHGEPIDVVSDGPFLASGEPVRVVRQDGGRVVVRRHEKSEDSAGR